MNSLYVGGPTPGLALAARLRVNWPRDAAGLAAPSDPPSDSLPMGYKRRKG